MSTHAAPTSRTRRVAVTAALVAGAVVLPTGVAQAYWRTTGSGTAAATAGTISPLVAQTATAAGPTLAPGGTGTLVVKVRNPNTVDVRLTSVSANGAPSAAGGLGTCTSFVLVLQTPTAGLPTVVPAGATVAIHLANGIALMSAENGCQGATFSVPVTVNGQVS
jgi:hypothetical protein